ncbi:hypothetical protein D7Z54_34320 [Salibacterium salarium]|uniref:Uncharacterized protein n=1 Tax=Salibacterium salarium TaxID=284579 RepID=A0A3R9QM44_9BACI|nr:hypothetical protein [Salibacterium salarium]RSL28849.1 hypothetical protein D7Z54_34320 [Salibacterium salarium]
MAFIMVDDMQIPAGKYESKEEAKKAATEQELIVKDNEGHFWVVDRENYPKIEGFGYSVVQI